MQLRKRYADRVRTIVTAAGAKVELDERPQDQETYVTITFPEVRLSFSIEDYVQVAVVCSWFGASRSLRWCSLFDSVNECHRHKATTIHDDTHAMLAWLPEACAAAMAGEIFV